MMIKRILLGFCLIVFVVGCTPGSISASPGAPTPNSSPDHTPADTSLPTFTLSPTPTPEVRIDTGEKALFNGDLDRALFEYQAALGVVQ